MTRSRERSNLDVRDDIEIVDYDPEWVRSFQLERELLMGALGGLSKEVHHIGSTSVPGMAAKPVVDILVASDDISDVNRFSDALAPLGYSFVPQDDPGRLFFRKGSPRTHHLHIVKDRSWPYYSHLLFRDFLIDHPKAAEEYECLKRVLARRFQADRAAYVEGKEAMVSMILGRAVREHLIPILDKSS